MFQREFCFNQQTKITTCSNKQEVGRMGMAYPVFSQFTIFFIFMYE